MMKLMLLPVFLCVFAPACSAQIMSSWNGIPVGSSPGQISKMNGKTIGTAAGNYSKWNNLAAPSSGPWPFTLVQAVGDDGGTLTVAPTGAGNLYVACYGEVGTATVTVSDNATGGSNTYTARPTATATNTSGGFTSGCLDVLGAANAGATTISFTFTGTASYAAIWFYEFHRTSGTWAFDNGVAKNNATGTGTSITGPAITLAGGIAVTASIVNDQIAVGGNPTPGNVFNAGGVLTGDGNGSVALINASGGTFASAQTDQISSDTYCASAVAYK